MVKSSRLIISAFAVVFLLGSKSHSAIDRTKLILVESCSDLLSDLGSRAKGEVVLSTPFERPYSVEAFLSDENRYPIKGKPQFDERHFSGPVQLFFWEASVVQWQDEDDAEAFRSKVVFQVRLLNSFSADAIKLDPANDALIYIKSAFFKSIKLNSTDSENTFPFSESLVNINQSLVHSSFTGQIVVGHFITAAQTKK